MAGHVSLKLWITVARLLLFLMQPTTEGAIMAPPWADPKLNPCAAQPRGWQLLFWPPDGKCYKIFQVGHPCPENMELTPSVSKYGKNLSAECRCPPKMSQSAKDIKCYKLFSLGPCNKGFFFAPDEKHKEERSKGQLGVCKQMKMCSNQSMVYWPINGECYQKLSRGPCHKGQLLFVNKETGLPECGCEDNRQLEDYRHDNGQCYQHFTRGPCVDKGDIFLPNKSCGCDESLPHYHEDTKLCFELDTVGPCNLGQLFQLDPKDPNRAKCSCKPGYVPYQNTTRCYRPYTRGPCLAHEILTDAGFCIDKPCPKAYLYFPREERCYRIGSKGPCSEKRLVTFDFDTRPSVDGISYNGVCRCKNKGCDKELDNSCDRTKGLIRYKNECHKIYTQGPCSRGAWLVPRREPRQELFISESAERLGECECIPGYTMTIFDANTTVCLPPTFILADYLNRNFTISEFV